MRRPLRAAWRLLRVAVHVLHGAAIVMLRFPQLDREARQDRIGWWSARLLGLAGIRIEARGRARDGGTLLVANHVSWLDITAVHAVCPRARFVSKADVRAWPVLNRLIDSAGTLYIERSRRRDAMRVMHEIGEALSNGDLVAVFPEGTTGEGPTLLPFHANLLQAAIAVGAPVQPVALRFADPAHAFSPAVAFVGDTTLLQSLWWVLCADGLRVHVEFLPAVGTAHADRRALAERLRGEIAAALGTGGSSPAAP